MSVRTVAPGVESVGAIDWDRRLFDDLIPLPEGTSYNSFLVRGSEKVALIDAVDTSMEMALMTNLFRAEADRIDYIVVSHAEQDHSGLVPLLLEMYGGATVVTSKVCKDLLIAFHGIPEERIQVVGDRETLSLGDKTLEFLITPWVHWPDTMLTWLREERVLFSCDLFGAHIATSDLFLRDRGEWFRAAKRYYAEIMMPFRGSIKGYLEKVRGLDPAIIAPSHGPLHDDPDGRPRRVRRLGLGRGEERGRDRLRLDARLDAVHGRLPGQRPDRPRRPRPAVPPAVDRHRRPGHGARGPGHDRDRGPDRPLRPAPRGGHGHVPRERAPAEGAVRDRA